MKYKFSIVFHQIEKPQTPATFSQIKKHISTIGNIALSTVERTPCIPPFPESMLPSLPAEDIKKMITNPLLYDYSLVAYFEKNNPKKGFQLLQLLEAVAAYYNCTSRVLIADLVK